MDNRPVGFYDSGLGGMTALKAFREMLPDENIVYFGDTARFPYGVRPQAELKEICKESLDLLKGYNVKAILAACGTISVNTSDVLSAYEIKTFNVFDPAVKAMSEVQGDKALAVIATNASIRSNAFQSAIAEASGKEVIGIPAQDLVTLCETGKTDENNEELKKVIEDCLGQVKGKIDALLLGCTHFGYASKAIADFLGDDVTLIEASREGAKVIAQYLIDNDLLGTGGDEKIICSGYNLCSETL